MVFAEAWQVNWFFFLSRDTKGNEKIVRTLATDSKLVYIYDQIDLLFLVIKKTRFRKVYTNA